MIVSARTVCAVMPPDWFTDVTGWLIRRCAAYSAKSSSMLAARIWWSAFIFKSRSTVYASSSASITSWCPPHIRIRLSKPWRSAALCRASYRALPGLAPLMWQTLPTTVLRSIRVAVQRGKAQRFPEWANKRLMVAGLALWQHHRLWCSQPVSRTIHSARCPTR